MKFSFIIPSYKPNEAYTNKCLDSILDLGIEVDDFEILLILNGPKYPFYDMLESTINKKVVRLIYTDKKGVSNARNIGLDQAKGENIIFVDDDDWISKGFVDFDFSDYNKDCIVVSNFKSYIEENNSLESDYLSEAFSNLTLEEYNLLKFRSFFSQVCGKIFPVQLIGKVRFNSSLSISEDALFMFEISNKVRRMYLLENSTYFRRVRRNSASNVKKTYFKMFSNMVKFIFALSKTYLKSPRKYCFKFYVSRVLASIKYFTIQIRK